MHKCPLQKSVCQSLSKSNTVLTMLHMMLNLCAPRPGALHLATLPRWMQSISDVMEEGPARTPTDPKIEPASYRGPTGHPVKQLSQEKTVTVLFLLNQLQCKSYLATRSCILCISAPHTGQKTVLRHRKERPQAEENLPHQHQ